MKSISLLVLFFVPINIHAVDNLRIPDIRCLGMGGNGVTQSVLFNPALVALHTDKVLYFEYFNRYGVKELGTMGIGFVYPNPLLSAGVDISSFGELVLVSNIRCYRPSCGKKYRSNFPQMLESCLLPLTNC